MSDVEPEPGQAGVSADPPKSPVVRDQPWVMRTYSGHSTARASNELYRTNLAKGQTGLSIAFDLPTQIGYDPDAPEAVGEVGKVGVPVAHLGHMSQLLDQIPVESMNTSMTINATAAWLLGLYIANAEDHGVDPMVLSGTTQNDIVKEYLSRGTYIFPPLPSLRLTVDTIAYTVRHVPKWNPINVCSYHLQEAGATPSQEVAYALATAIGVLDAVRDSGQIPDERVPLGGRPDLLLRQRRGEVRRGDLQDAGLHRPVGAGVHRTVRRHRAQAEAVPLRRPGQLARADRGPTREQCPSHRPRVAGGDVVQTGPGPGHAAPGLERGARPAPTLGPAVVAPHPADPGLRVGPARVRRHLRRLGGHREEDRTRWPRRRGPSWRTCSIWAGRSRPSTNSRPAWWGVRPSGSGVSRPASCRWSGSTASPRRPNPPSSPRMPVRGPTASPAVRSCGSIRPSSRSCGPTWRHGGRRAIPPRSSGPSTS